MPRKSYKKHNWLEADSRYNSLQVAKFVNKLMHAGKKSVAERIFYSAMDIIKEKIDEEPLVVFTRALENARPSVEVKSRRVGGANYQVPVEIRPERRDALAVRWIISFARNRGEKGMQFRLANEIIDAFKNTGATIKKKEETHRMAEANKAFSHFRW
ncbi:MAG: 30S ribosomal protein S7 [Spirochaetota bacterium]|nr:30S ribosomal protein S7 [Spirochaetota bacterium]